MVLCSRIFNFKGFILAVAIFIGIYRNEILEYAVENFEICPKIDQISTATSEEPQQQEEVASDKPKYWLIGDETTSTVKDVLERIGLEEFNGTLKTENNHEGWNLLWSSKTSLPINWKAIKYHQKFNHFPFSKYLSSKSYFSSTTDSIYVPKAFLDSDKLKTFAASNPKKRFVKKSKTKSGVSFVKNVNRMSFTSDDDYFVQELVEDPLLFDGKMFEMSIFVLMTSVEPLRLYYYPQNVVPRFCPENYDSLDFSDEDSFVVGDSHITPLDFEGTRDYFLNGYTFRDAIDGFLRKQDADVDGTWTKVEDAIRSVVVSKEKDFIEFFNNIREFKYPYFELYSFDFIIDKSFNPHIININANPDISGTAKYDRFRPFYESLVYNVLEIVGVATPYIRKDFVLATVQLEMMVTHVNTRAVMPEFCIFDCDKSCDGKCAMCTRCMSQNHLYETVLSYNEERNLGNFKRLFPPEKEFLDKVGDGYLKGVEPDSQYLIKWYGELCKRSKKFC